MNGPPRIPLAATPGALRPGTTSPGSTSPFVGAPPPDRPAHPTPDRLRHSLLAGMFEGMLAEVVGACAGGAVLTGWALHLGFAPADVALLASLPLASQMVHLPAGYLTERWGGKGVALVATTLSRSLYAAFPLLLLFPPTTARPLLLVLAGLNASLGVVGNNAWVTWMGDLVPTRLRGRYFGRRMALTTATGTAASLLAGLFLDFGPAPRAVALSALALVAAGAGLTCTALMATQRPPARRPTSEQPHSVVESFRKPELRAFATFHVVWNASIGLAGGLFSYHMLKNLEMGFALCALHGAGLALARIAAAQGWGRVIDRFGPRRVLAICSLGVSFVPLFWLFPTPAVLWPLVIEALVAGALWSGHGLAMFNLPLQLVPRSGRAVHLGLLSGLGGLSFAAGSVVGGRCIEVLPEVTVIAGRPIQAIHLMFLLTAAARMGASLFAWRFASCRPIPAMH